MYTKNKKISDRQIFRQMILVSLPLNLILFPYLTIKLPFPYIMFMCGFMAVVNILVIYLLKKYISRKLLSKPINILIKIKHFIMGTVVMIVLVNSVRDLLLDTVHPLIIVCSTLIFIYYFTKEEQEVFARFTEILFYPVIFITVLVLVLGILDKNIINADYRKIFSIKWKECDIYRIIERILLILFLFIPWDGFIMAEEYCEKLKNSHKTIIKAVISSWFITFCYVFAIYFKPGVKYMSSVSYPFILMLKIVGIPGGFLERQEALFGVFIIMGLIVELAFHGKIILENLTPKNKTGEKKSAYKASSDMAEYGRVWMCIGILAASMMYFMGEVNNTDVKLSIYSGKDVEDRVYVYAMYIDDKEIGFEGEEFLTYEGDLVEIFEEYKNESVKQPDFTHVKVIVLGEGIWKYEEETEMVREILKNNRVSLNAIVCRTNETSSDVFLSNNEEMKNCEENQNTVAMVLGDILLNNGYEYCNILYFQDILERRGMEAVTELPLLCSDGGICISKSY